MNGLKREEKNEQEIAEGLCRDMVKVLEEWLKKEEN